MESSLVRACSWMVAALLVASCAEEQRPRPRAPRARLVRAPDPAPGPARREVAHGDARSVLLALRRVYFALDEATLPEPSRTALAEAAERLRALADVKLAIEGHADERGTNDYNLGLGQRRSRAVFDHLVRLGIGPEHLEIISYGEERPAAVGSSADTWSRNRRVEFSLLRGDVQLVLEDGVRVSDRGQPLP